MYIKISFLFLAGLVFLSGCSSHKYKNEKPPIWAHSALLSASSSVGLVNGGCSKEINNDVNIEELYAQNRQKLLSSISTIVPLHSVLFSDAVDPQSSYIDFLDGLINNAELKINLKNRYHNYSDDTGDYQCTLTEMNEKSFRALEKYLYNLAGIEYFPYVFSDGKRKTVRYPKKAKRRAIEGQCSVSFQISDLGLADNIDVYDCSPTGYFELAIERHYQSRRYKISDVESHDASRTYKQVIEFNLPGNSSRDK